MGGRGGGRRDLRERWKATAIKGRKKRRRKEKGRGDERKMKEEMERKWKRIREGNEREGKKMEEKERKWTRRRKEEGKGQGRKERQMWRKGIENENEDSRVLESEGGKADRTVIKEEELVDV